MAKTLNRLKSDVSLIEIKLETLLVKLIKEYEITDIDIDLSKITTGTINSNEQKIRELFIKIKITL